MNKAKKCLNSDGCYIVIKTILRYKNFHVLLKKNFHNYHININHFLCNRLKSQKTNNNLCFSKRVGQLFIFLNTGLKWFNKKCLLSKNNETRPVYVKSEKKMIIKLSKSIYSISFYSNS